MKKPTKRSLQPPRAPRDRGGASCQCPRLVRHKKCGADSRVLKTRRVATGGVLRFRECTAGHRFTTEENPSE